MATQKFGIRGLSTASVAGLAFTAGTLAVLTFQQRQYNRMRLRVEQQRVHQQLLSKAMDDPELAVVMSTVDLSTAPATERPRLRRQYLFANALYTNALHTFYAGDVNWQELHGHLRVLCQSSVFRDFWEATRHHRDSLDDSSQEARVGKMVDGLVRDLAEADTEEWWVVGEPPSK
ncbi:hypothetical protein J8N05_32785 [Streptomyces sp. BH-SS-21]|uniref:Uncharacterized protein n=1 Tax=Streptomyces liliiviolaceus TaxID=2823109 RepID=A0A940XW33_9ACTN|nr:hypothetical protein [Streptomyces liliiviolaceus]